MFYAAVFLLNERLIIPKCFCIFRSQHDVLICWFP